MHATERFPFPPSWAFLSLANIVNVLPKLPYFSREGIPVIFSFIASYNCTVCGYNIAFSFACNPILGDSVQDEIESVRRNRTIRGQNLKLTFCFFFFFNSTPIYIPAHHFCMKYYNTTLLIIFIAATIWRKVKECKVMIQGWAIGITVLTSAVILYFAVQHLQQYLNKMQAPFYPSSGQGILYTCIVCVLVLLIALCQGSTLWNAT